MAQSYREGYHLQNRFGTWILEQGQLTGRFRRSFTRGASHHASAQRRRDVALVSNRAFEVGLRRADILDQARKAVETAHAIHFLGMPHLRRIQGSPHETDRLIVSLQRNRKGMAVFATVGK